MSRRCTSLTLAALALIAFVLWIARSSNDGVDAGLRTEVSPQSQAARARIGAADGETNSRDADTQRDETSSAASVEVPPLDEVAPVEHIEVRVVLMPARKPVEGARIRFWSPPKLSNSQRWKRWEEALESNQLEELLSEHTLEAPAGESGRTAIPAASSGMVVADAEGVFGVAWCESDRTAPLVVEVHRDFALAARVVDASGSTKAGIEVGLRVDYDWGELSDIASAVTSSEGVAVIEHAGWTLTQWEVSGDQRVALAIAGPLDPSVENEIDVSAPPTAPVELRLGAYGELEVAAFDAEGRPLAAEDEVVLHRIERPAPTERGYEIYPGVSSPLHDGVALFRCVALEREFAAELHFAHGRSAESRIGHGPLRAGDRARIELRLGPQRGIEARLVDVAAAPVVECQVEVFIEREPDTGAERLGASRTDIEGRLRIAEASSDAVRLVFVVEDELGRERGAAHANVPGRANAASIDLGELVVSPMPTIAAGRVVDATGHTIRGARVQARAGVVDERDPSRTNWRDFTWNDTRTDDQGRFELRSEFRGARLALEASWGETRSAPLEIPPGARDLELVVEATGIIAGALRLDRSVPAASLQVFAEFKGLHAQREPDFEGWRVSAVDPHGAFALVDLDPGIYDVRVRQHNGGWGELARVEDIVVRAGETCTDPRLNPLEIAHRGLTLHVVDEHGAPVHGGVCWARFHDTPPDEWENVELLRGRGTIAVQVLPVDLAISCNGYLAQFLGPVAASREVVLQRAPRVRFELDPAPAVTVEGVWLGIELSPSGSGSGIFDRTELEFGARPTAMGFADFIGKANVVVFVAGPDSQHTWQWQVIDQAEPRTITIGPASEHEQSFRIRIEPAALKLALETFKR